MKYSQEELQRRAQHAMRHRGQPGQWEVLLLKLSMRFPWLDLRTIDTPIQRMARGETIQ